MFWELPTPNDFFALSRNIPAAQWRVHDVPSAHVDPVASVAGVAAAFPDEPICVAVEDGDPPACIPRSSLERVDGLVAAVSYWDEDRHKAPDEALGFTERLEVYRLVP